MLSPWRMCIVFYILLASGLLPTGVLSYPVGPSSNIALTHDHGYLHSFATRSPSSPVKKKKRVKSPSPNPTSSSVQHHQANPRTPPKGPAGTLPNNIDPSPGKKIPKLQAHLWTKTNVKASQLKKSTYRKQTKADHPNSNKFWNENDADHILEAQTVSSKINKFLPDGVLLSKECLKQLRQPLNDKLNLSPLKKELNSEKRKIINQFAHHDLYNHMAGPKPGTHKPFTRMSPDLKAYMLLKEEDMKKTAIAVDKAIDHKDCHQVHNTPLYKGNRIAAQTDDILKHVHAS